MDALCFLFSPRRSRRALRWFRRSPSLTRHLMHPSAVALIIVWLGKYHPDTMNVTHITNYPPVEEDSGRQAPCGVHYLWATRPGAVCVTWDQASERVCWSDRNFKGVNSSMGKMANLGHRRCMGKKAPLHILAPSAGDCSREHPSLFFQPITASNILSWHQKAWVFQDAFLECWASHGGG